MNEKELKELYDEEFKYFGKILTPFEHRQHLFHEKTNFEKLAEPYENLYDIYCTQKEILLHAFTRISAYCEPDSNIMQIMNEARERIKEGK